jgi:PilZ domain-containing protein
MPTPIHSFARILSFPRERRSPLVARWPVPAERRLKFRYPVDLNVRLRFSAGRASFSGAGLVVNISSGGILVASEDQLVVGALVEMSIEWPALLDGRVPLQLVATGRVLRREASYFAAAFQRHEFRTIKRLSLPPN